MGKMEEKARGGIKLEAKLLVLFSILVASVLNALYAGFVEQVTIVYTHFFYIPILLAGMWYKRKEAVAVALFLGIVHILITYLSPHPLTVNEFARAAIFILVAYVIGYVSEQRAEREDAVREREEKYSAFFKTSRDPVFITSTDGRWLDFNDAMEELLGYESRDELFKVRIPDLYENPEDRGRHTELINQEGFTKEFPVNLRRKDGSIINVLVTSVAKKDENGDIIGYLGTIRDITERKKAEEAIKRRLDFEETVATISSRFVGTSDTDAAINDSLADVGKLSKANRAYLFLSREGGTVMDNTHEWCAGGSVHR